jgi:hypothetical protein
MPPFFPLPTIPFLSFPSSGFASVQNQTATTSGGMGRLRAYCEALQPGGTAGATTALGTSSLFVAPPETTFLDVFADTSSLESGSAVIAPLTFSNADAYADLSIFVQEFSPTGAFVRGVSGPATVVYDAHAAFPGVPDIRSRERHTRSALIHMPVVAGFSYRIWLVSFQYANTWANAFASSSFTYDFGPLFCAFI